MLLPALRLPLCDRIYTRSTIVNFKMVVYLVMLSRTLCVAKTLVNRDSSKMQIERKYPAKKITIFRMDVKHLICIAIFFIEFINTS